MTETLTQSEEDIKHHSKVNPMTWFLGKISPSRKSRETTSEAVPPRYVIEHAGWAAVGWSEGDPTADEAISALVSLNKVDFASAMAGLRKSGEASLRELESGSDQRD
jgi:hypothetical protein